MATAVNDRSAEATAMQHEQEMLEALMAGTKAMRDGGEKFLPRFPAEETDVYNKRKALATLFPAYRRTVGVMSGKPFSKQCILSEDTPVEIAGQDATDTSAEVAGWADDIDREGVSLHTFAAEMFAETFYGLCGILVDAPKPPAVGARPVTRADEKAAGIRPYWVRVKHDQLLGWRVETINGARTLTQLRISECATVPDGEFGTKDVSRVRVLERGSWRLFEEQTGADGKKTYVQLPGADGAGLSGLSYIPFVPLYGYRKGFMSGRPPLLDLAYLNVKHWQSQSDQDNILHIVRVPILTLSGGDDKAVLTVGAASAVKLPTGAELKFTEHTGAGIDAGAKSLQDLEDQMIQAGAELLVKTPGQRTATESNNDAEANKCDLQRMVEDFEDALDSALAMTADYAKLATGGNVSLFRDFGASTLTDASALLIQTLEASGVITKQTAIKELQRRGTLSPDIDPDEEVQAVADQAPDIAPVVGAGGPEPIVPPEGQQAA